MHGDRPRRSSAGSEPVCKPQSRMRSHLGGEYDLDYRVLAASVMAGLDVARTNLHVHIVGTERLGLHVDIKELAQEVNQEVIHRLPISVFRQRQLAARSLDPGFQCVEIVRNFRTSCIVV